MVWVWRWRQKYEKYIGKGGANHMHDFHWGRIFEKDNLGLRWNMGIMGEDLKKKNLGEEMMI
jgi:hypothetical protein